MISKYVIPKFAPSQIVPTQTEFCCSSSTDEDVSSSQYINTLCLMGFYSDYAVPFLQCDWLAICKACMIYKFNDAFQSWLTIWTRSFILPNLKNYSKLNVAIIPGVQFILTLSLLIVSLIHKCCASSESMSSSIPSWKNFNCACPAIQNGQGSGFLSEGSSWHTACMSEQQRF